MQELEKIFEEIEQNQVMLKPFDEEDRPTGIINVDVVKEIIRKHMNDGWIPVEERLPDKEAREFIDEKLKGIGHLYPCLVTYKNSVTGRVYTALFYYDIRQKWFVNAGENLLHRVSAWRPRPEPYDPEGKEE